MSHKILVVGAGICGMCSALALAKKGHQITIYERDIPPPEGGADQAFFDWNRRGASQFRHPHAFLGLLCNLIEQNYPDLMALFLAAGARKLSFTDMLPPELLNKYRAEPEDNNLWILMCRRATLETVLRRYVEGIANIRIVNSTHVIGILTAESGQGSSGLPVISVTGLQLNCQGEKSEDLADLVIDASGRSTRFPAWFEALGQKIEHTVDDAKIVYYSKHYQLNPGIEEPPRHGKERAAGDLGYLKYGVFPGDNGHFAIIVCVPEEETIFREAVRDGEQFDRMCRNIPGLVPWLNADKMQQTTSSFGIAEIHAVWRSYVKDDHALTHNFFAIGDAVIRTNPLYGRGCSIGALHAHLLADIIENTEDPVERALEFNRQTEAELRPIFKASLSEDRSGIKRAQAMARGELLEQTRGLKAWFGAAFGDALAGAMRDQVHVIRGMMRTVNLLEKPGDFLKEPRIRWTILRYMLRGRKKNAKARIVNGPSRDEMLALFSDEH